MVGLEHPHRWGGLLDLPAALDSRAAGRVVAVLAGLQDEDQVAVRPAGVFARRLITAPIAPVPTAVPTAASTASLTEATATLTEATATLTEATATLTETASASGSWQPRGTILITGGTGGIGGRIAHWAAGNGAEHIVLTSRRGLAAPGAEQLRDELTALGVRVTVSACDLSDRAQVAQLLGRHAEDEIRTVIHAAGMGAISALEDTDPDLLDEVLAGKLAGAVHLDELLGDTPLDAFVVFSSLSGVWGSQGHAAYAAANAGLDALAERRRSAGRVMTSVAWGTWAEVGMAADEEVAGQLRRCGLVPMPPDLAIEAMREAIEQDDITIAVGDINWERFASVFTAARARPLIGDLPQVVRALNGTGSAQRHRQRQRHRSGSTGSPAQASCVSGSPPPRRHRNAACSARWWRPRPRAPPSLWRGGPPRAALSRELDLDSGSPPSSSATT